MDTPLVSIGLLTCNRPLTFTKALNSLITQSYKNIEIIIGDNSSNNESKNVYMEYANDNRIKYYKHQENIGAIKNFEFTRNMAAGKYFMWTSDDDYWDITFIEKAVEKLENDHSAVACWSSIQFFDDDGMLDKPSSFKNQDVSKDSIVNSLIKVNMQTAWFEFYCLAKIDIVKQFNFDSYNTIGSDVIFINHILLSGKCLMINEPLFYYYFTSISGFDRHNYKSDIYNEYARINPYFDFFIKCFQIVLYSNNLNIFQKINYYLKYWWNIIFIYQNHIIGINMFPVAKFFQLSIQKKNIDIVFICMPLIIFLFFRKIINKIKSKIKFLLKIVSRLG